MDDMSTNTNITDDQMKRSAEKEVEVNGVQNEVEVEVEIKHEPQAPKTPSNAISLSNGDNTNFDESHDQKSILEKLEAVPSGDTNTAAATATPSASATATNSVTTTPSNTKKSSTPSRGTPASQSKLLSFLFKTSNNGKMTYLAMVHETIADIGDRTGSSVPAIQKVMKKKYEHLAILKQKPFNTNVYNAIKAGLKQERFIKVKNSYKINTSWVNKQKAMHRAKEVKKKIAEKKRKKEVEKAKLEREKKKKMEIKEREMAKKKEKEMTEMAKKKEKEAEKVKVKVLTEEEKAELEEKKRQREEAERKKKEAEEKARKLAERIKKRKFPMDDIELIAEDRELGVKRSSDVAKVPFMPFTMTSLMGFDDRPPTRKSTSTTIINACSATMSEGTRSTISDAFQIFHFFRGDVGYGRIFHEAVPKFTFKNLLYAINEVLIGNAKKSQLVPLLISQLFYASLTILTNSEESDWATASEDEEEKNKWASLKQDLVRLNATLDEASWGYTLMCYLDLMDRFYSSDATSDSNVLPGFPITLVEDGSESDDEEMKDKDSEKSSDEKESDGDTSDESKKDFVDGYHGYLGPEDGVISKGYVKLLRYDPWCLTAEEMISLLRVLTDDILAMKAPLKQEFEKRDEETLDLFKAKKAAESCFRKIRLAYEGPKWPSKAKVKKSSPDEDKDEKKDQNEKQDGGDNDDKSKQSNVQEKKFKPTVTKQEFEVADKARIKAAEQYEKKVKNLVMRTEPFGYDRSHNAFYFSHHDPEMIHFEMNKNVNDELYHGKSWHCIDHKSLFDVFITSLDVRGVRESALHEHISNYGGSGMRRYLSDNNKKMGLISARRREEEEFARRLNNALIASADQGRRSGRLASVKKDEVAKIQEEMDLAMEKFEKDLEIINNDPDYQTLTGIHAVEEFEARESVPTDFSKFYDEDSKTSGYVNFIISKILDLESFCEDLDPSEPSDVNRERFISNIQEVGDSYETSVVMGPKPKPPCEVSSSATKRQRKSFEPSPSGTKATSRGSSLTQVLAALKDPLIELETRMYSILGLERAICDADYANDNMSTGSCESNEMSEEQKAIKKAEKVNIAWKKKLNTLHNIPTKRVSAIREVLISAIAIARKGNSEEVLHDLRGALILHRPGAAGGARQTALAVLRKHGGYQHDDESSLPDDDEDFDDENAADDSSKDNTSYLCTEAMIMNGCLEGDNNADRVDWKEAVMECKTLSRFSALVAALSSRALPKLQKLSDDRHTFTKAIKYWEAGTKTRKSRSQKKSKEKYNSATEIWTNTTQTDEFVHGKVEGYPWWPARICVAKNTAVMASLESLDRVLISFIGEPHLHVIKREGELRPFIGNEQEDMNLGDFPADITKSLQESTTMARRILRGKNALNTNKNFAEEKKSAT